ncbi:hypothetical protein HanRHA438_Chr01g0042381 [Helianthus annuus]|uniref:Uncharacterized protein n=1 Tax=Helianthus annuus TaxID=4232 RepID=A0A251VSH0_HELAN|nr:hypothetical protein HanXRQr2_Chr01g0041521 [Helianthus annuus]KAJ0613045.1 hypothetical protein HanHA300_Chr01g0033961 [Helianthus annuus]KAJ0624726.1 hypothetical protein HanIR_Chr01g0046181 [Helianthus annuus]KAJ0628424.1 hypothetical protein HanHA89_Chr01g0036411 [Helianthus annuus]KAJ0784701.1 hypothetical protein HanLR1_Chr01g0034811 [Helianthus annuus]
MISNGATSTTTTADAAASSSSNTAAQSLGLKNFFKTPGRYKLLHDKTHPSSLLPYALAKSITQSSNSTTLNGPQLHASSPFL